MSIAAIPTVYNGIQFRSRLEARWAAFLDRTKLPWSYEPLDFNGYIPDFRITTPENFISYRSLFLEVKPSAEFDPVAAKKMRQISDANFMDGVFILRDAPIRMPEIPFVRRIGWNATYPETQELAVVAGNGDLHLCLIRLSSHLSMIGRRSINLAGGPLIDAAWADACNATQWKGAQNRG